MMARAGAEDPTARRVEPELMTDVQFTAAITHEGEWYVARCVQVEVTQPVQKLSFESDRTLKGGHRLQTNADEEILRTLPQAYCDAWNRRDAHAVASIMADDVDFVTVGTVYLHGRTDWETYHARLLNGRFKDSIVAPLQTTVRLIRPDIGIIHWSWRVTGDKDPDGTPRPPRHGLLTMVAEKRDGTWQVIVAQNTNTPLGTPPELAGLNTPIAIPGSD